MPVNIPLPRWAQKDSHKKVYVFCLSVLAIVSILWISAANDLQIPIPGQPTFSPDPKLDKVGQNGAVASDVEQCSKMGVSILEDGGNAADAAVAVALCIGSINSQSSGIGGGGFITVRMANGTSIVIDCRETAPKKAHKHMYDGNSNLSKVGGLAVGVPGELKGLQKLYDMFGSGTKTWKELVDPVAEINEVGFSLSPKFSEYIRNNGSEITGLITEHGGWEWLMPDNTPSSLPDIITRPNFARTLRKIANEGADAFYNQDGEIAQSIEKIVKLTGGVLTAEDIGNYDVVLRETLHTNFMGREVTTSGAPTSGPALILGLHLIEPLLDDKSFDMSPRDSQRLIEVMKWIAAGRSELGDPAYVNNTRIDKIITRDWAEDIRGNISDEQTLPSWRDYHPAYEMNDPHGTAHFSVLDKDGNAVAMTTTVNLLFGCLVADPVTGIVLNSEMDDFSQPLKDNFFGLSPSIYNFIEPGKRPLSSTCPSILTLHGEPELVIGASGGSHIVTSVFEAMVRTYGYGMSLLDVISYPKLHHQLIPEQVSMEVVTPLEVKKSLEQRGHKVVYQRPSTAMNGIFKDSKGWIHAVSDFYRKSGIAAAY